MFCLHWLGLLVSLFGFTGALSSSEQLTGFPISININVTSHSTLASMASANLCVAAARSLHDTLTEDACALQASSTILLGSSCVLRGRPGLIANVDGLAFLGPFSKVLDVLPVLARC
jgi:hypothetical protein